MGRVAAYYRLSMEDRNGREESGSIANQRLLIKKYISEDHELCAYEFCEFCDDGYSGMSMDRPGMQEMLRQIKDSRIQAVVVKDISRFSRDYIELGTYMEQIFPFLGVVFIAVTDHYDSRQNTQGVDTALAFQGLLADFYCRDVSVKVKSALQAKRKQGKYSTGSVPFGYAKDSEHPDRIVVVPQEAEIVRHMFQLSASGCNLNQICRILNDENIMTPLEFKNLRKKQNRRELQREHKFWLPGTVRAILTNETYLGHMVYGKTEQIQGGAGKRRIKPREEWNIFEHHHEPVVDKQLFDKVQARYTRKKEGNRKVLAYPLKGKVFCRYCKRTLKLLQLAEGKRCFYCQNARISSHTECLADFVDKEELDGILLRAIQNQLLEQVDWNWMFLRARRKRVESVKQAEKALEELEKKQAELGRQKRMLLEKYHAGRLDKQQFQEEKEKITGEIAELDVIYEQQKKKRQKQKEFRDKIPNSREALLRYAGMESMTAELAEAFVKRIEIDRDGKIDIYWTFHN